MNTTLLARARRAAGFMLIELLVVLVILTLLGRGLVGPKVLTSWRRNP